ncbi:MAG: DUF4417 domain-containing protein [Clostridiales Family XIII bacterium]|jgi:hypothetical protein|nr:DUF4417 domain-containing protein [Clostridiales Family XIII bacterium]
MTIEKQEQATRTLEPYFYNDFLMDGKYDLPLVGKQKIDLTDLKLIRFSNIVKDENEEKDATVHFFEFDNKFDEVWKNPKDYIGKLKQYKQVLSPNFSLYTTMSVALQIFNTFRSRWCADYWQRNGMTVIPTVVWSDEHSYDFAFDGIEEGSIVALSTVGCSDYKRLFMKGFNEMCKHIKPEKVICYAKPFEEMRDLADLVEVPYVRNERIAPAKVYS